ncbi:MAG TPA: hypothetical protein VHP11_04355, partial [Tepidisphaeraceae bacterium]|nr:hypothetical protein [Tepidisphaeraceae bacterium]
MAKKKTSSAGFSALINALAAARGVLLGMTLAALLVGGVGFGFHKLRQYVERTLAYPPSQPVVVIKNRPAWMGDALASRITTSVQPHGLRSAMDHQLLKEVAEVLQRNPWVRQVRHVRRVFTKAPGDTVEIDCEFRAPMALVPYRNEYILIDNEGYKLPERFPAKENPRIMFGADGRVNLRIIEGVAVAPPLLDGQKWLGDDLQAGL